MPKKWLLLWILALGAANVARGQESGAAARTGEASEGDFTCAGCSANTVSPHYFSREFLSGASEDTSSAWFLDRKPADIRANLAPVPSAALAPAPQSPRVYRDTIYRWDLGVGFTYVKFRSSTIDSGMSGLDTSVTYFAKDWLGVEGNITAAFGGKIFANELERYASFTGGPKIAFHKERWEPWGHFLVGLGRVNPEIAAFSRNGFAMQMGGGADIPLSGPFAARIEGDWVRTQLYKSSQNNFQMVLGIVFHLSF